MSRGLRLTAAAILGWLVHAAQAEAVTLDTGRGLQVTFSDMDGAVTAVSVDGVPVPLVADEAGGFSARVGEPIAPYGVQQLDFDAGTGPLVSARNAAWEDHGSYVGWLADGGLDGTGHLLLGDGVTEGAGMAMAAQIAVTPGSKLRISWQARSASVATTHILCVRIYDALGEDITSSANTPAGWGYTGTSQAHGVWGFGCSQSNTWESFERHYQVSTQAAFVRVSLRHWTGGDHLLHVDDFALDVVGGIAWRERANVVGTLTPLAGGFMQSGVVPGESLQVNSSVSAGDGHLAIEVSLQDTSIPSDDRAVELRWTLPVAAAGGQWWDDIAVARSIEPGVVYRNTFENNRHAISYYPFSSITGAGFGLSLAVPQEIAAVQRFEYDTAVGLQCVWEIGLSPVTVHSGPGRAELSAVVLAHDAAWGFRAAAARYYALFPENFVKRSVREGAWMYPIRPSQIPNPLDFGFAFLETWPIDAAERAVCEQTGIGVFYYTEPWLAWQPWGADPQKPSYEERVARLNAWMLPAALATWVPDGGPDGSAHLLLGDGASLGAGMVTAEPFAVAGGATLDITWQARVVDPSSTQILCVRLFDEEGADITPATPAPPGWFWSSASQAHTVAGMANSQADAWQVFAQGYVVASPAVSMQVSLRHWNGGDHHVHVDDLRVADAAGLMTWLEMAFDADDGSWRDAQHGDWEDPAPGWLRVDRELAAQTVAAASPLDADGRYFIDLHSYFWHEWAAGSWNQAWPMNPDPDLPAPAAHDLYLEHWIQDELDVNAGVYIDSVTASATVGGWENHRPDHLAVSDAPLTFSWDDGRAVQLAPQAHAEFLDVIAGQVRDAGKLMMLNLFPSASRFHSHNADLMGSEISQFVESQSDSRLRRTLARHRIVSNLLQWGWDQPVHATLEQMEAFIRGQLFWGFYPAVSSAGGLLDGGTPDRYFLHPELYERDRPLFVTYIPVIRALSSAGWEPLTNASVDAGGDVERFGDFSRGDVLFSVRGADGAALDAEVTVDLEQLGLEGECPPVAVLDTFTTARLASRRLSGPSRVRFGVVLAPGEVGVYRLTAYDEGDFDGDGDIDSYDFVQLGACFLGPDEALTDPACALADVDCDGDFDLADFGRVQRF